MGCSPWGCKESDTTEQLTLRLLLLSTHHTLSSVPAAHALCRDGAVGQTEGPTTRCAETERSARRRGPLPTVQRWSGRSDGGTHHTLCRDGAVGQMEGTHHACMPRCARPL